mmetsp:Transcript_12898/g.23421  ORF Transcript_12898/g.23421 Transcript_12898/m.23421 type:complete len:648 (+) Transcript_12898:194-2137(+)|eukprot:CAMPEP_0197519610 /NCGR_PEP_ID=MMETSP1318-20131121/4879_1 /TAXON_ID=552666 /ORGANISM="Partenskyella glossopodia, Strain RCC365" /LENGTH=647 /DNA_ID=CAMNT_0043070691 /DNA_START=121 /DNA_END=2064 /DNA_ORIENTATION=+
MGDLETKTISLTPAAVAGRAADGKRSRWRMHHGHPVRRRRTERPQSHKLSASSLAKHDRFDSGVNSVIVVIRDVKKELTISGPDHTFKWLGYTAVFQYVASHGFKDPPDKYIVTEVMSERTHDILMPQQRITDRVLQDKETIIVKIEAKAPTREEDHKKMSLWEAVAYTPKDDWGRYLIKAKLDEKQFVSDGEHFDYDDFINKKIELWTNLDGWVKPIEFYQKDRISMFKIKTSLVVPPGVEICFYLKIDGKKCLAKNFKKKRCNIHKNQELVNYFVKPHNLRGLHYIDDDNPDDLEKEIDREEYCVEEEEEEEEPPPPPPYLYQTVRSMGEMETHEAFQFDWEEMQILDVVRDKEERKQVKHTLNTNWKMLRNIFQRCAGRDYPLEYMSALDFLNFVKETKLVKYNFTITLASVLFKRVNIMEIQTEENMNQKGFTLYEDPTNPETLFTRAEWMESLIRIANYWSLNKSIPEKFNTIVRIVLKKHSAAVTRDKTRELMSTEEVKNVYMPYLEKIYGVFAYYATTVDESTVVHDEEMRKFFAEFSINKISPKLIRRGIGQALANAQCPHQVDERGYMTDYAEWLEMIARIAMTAYPKLPHTEAIDNVLAYMCKKGVELGILDTEELEEATGGGSEAQTAPEPAAENT